MEYAAESGKQEIAEELLSWFLEREAYDCFAATLFQVIFLKYLQTASVYLLTFKFFSVTTSCDQTSSWSWHGDTISWILQCPTWFKWVSNTLKLYGWCYFNLFSSYLGHPRIHLESGHTGYQRCPAPARGWPGREQTTHDHPGATANDHRRSNGHRARSVRSGVPRSTRRWICTTNDVPRIRNVSGHTHEMKRENKREIIEGGTTTCGPGAKRLATQTHTFIYNIRESTRRGGSRCGPITKYDPGEQ